MIFFWNSKVPPDGRALTVWTFVPQTEQKDVSCANESWSSWKVKLMTRFDAQRLPHCSCCRRFTPSAGRSTNGGHTGRVIKASEQGVFFLENTFATNFTSLTTNDLACVWLTANIDSLRWKSSPRVWLDGTWVQCTCKLSGIIKCVELNCAQLLQKNYRDLLPHIDYTTKSPHASERGQGV